MSHFRLFQEGQPIGMGLVTLDGRFLRVNPALCRIGGYEESELLGLMFQEIVPDEERNPGFVLHNVVEAQVRERGIVRIHVSMTHDAGVATAFVVTECAP